MALPFKTEPLKTPNLLQRVLNRKPKKNIIVEINNRLAQASSIRQVTVGDVQAIADNYKVNLQKEFPKELALFYENYLKHCLIDKTLTEEETAELSHLKHLLGLNDKAIDKIHKEVAEAVYHESINEAISDGRLDPHERTFLEKLQRELKLPDEIAQKIYAEKATKHLETYFQTTITDERLSPEEEGEVRAIAKSLGIKPVHDDKTKHLLERYRLYWLIENGDIPEIDVDIKLQRNEKCYFSCNTEWHEHRKVTRRIQYGGPVLRFKLLPGLYWRMGDLGFRQISDDVLAHIDTGRLFLTNKRLIFMGSRKNTTIRLNKIIDFTPYKNGVDIQKDSGKSPFLKFGTDIDIFSMILGRVIQEGN